MSQERTPLLSVRNLVVNYGAIKALQGLDLDVYAGEIVAVIGANGAGKSTLMNAVMGSVPRAGGEVFLEGRPLPTKSFQVVNAGVSISPEGRKVFAPLTTYENLRMGAFPQKSETDIQGDLRKVYDLFPRLEERKDQYAGTLSGGEQQMLAIGRALMARPRVLLLDEPSLGLAPLIIRDIFDIIDRLRHAGNTILIVEQNAFQTLKIADYAYVLELGRVSMQGKASELIHNDALVEAYLGGQRA